MTVERYLQPESVAEAITLLEEHGPTLLVMAGGTLAMPLVNDGISLPAQVMGLRHAGLGQLRRDGDTLRIGATVTLTQLLNQSDVPILREAARRTASWAVRNLGTVGGNLFAPPPGGDVAVALLAADASVTLAGPRGTRDLALVEFFTGFMTNRLEPDELVVEIGVPLRDGPTAFLKLGRKHANTPAVVTVAVRLELDGDRVADARIALGAVGPHPIRAMRAERLLVGADLGPTRIGEAATAAAEDCEPFTDAVATEWYRRRMTRLLVQRALEQVAPPAAGQAP